MYYQTDNWSVMADAFRVLYVDDEPDLLNIGKMFLQKSGDFTVTTAMSGPEAIRLLEQERFDAIISDYQMTDMDGIQFLVTVRTRFGLIPFILFTGRGREEVVIQAINSGADFYLQKGGNPQAQFAELANQIKQAVSRRRAEKALKESEEKYRQLVELAKEGIWAIDAGYNTTYVNPRMAEMLQYTVDEMQGLSLISFMDDAGKRVFAEKMDGRLQGIAEEHPFEFITKGGSRIYVTISTSPLTDDKGVYQGAIAVISDITGHKRAEEALRESETRYRTLAESSTDNIFIIGRDDTIRFVNTQAAGNLHLPAGEIIGKPRKNFFHLDIADTQGKCLQKVFKTGETFRGEDNIVYGNQEFWQDTALVPLKDETGNVAAVLGVSRDITERKRGEEALRYQNEMRETILDSIPVMVMLFNREGHFQLINRCLQSTLGWSFEEMLQHKDVFSEFYPDPEYRESVFELIRRAEGTGRWSDFKTRRRDGHVLDTSWTNVPLSDGSILGIGIDITERKLAEEALREANKKLNLLFDISRQDINRQLAVLTENLRILQRKQQDTAHEEYLQKISGAVRSISGLVRFAAQYEQVGANESVWLECRTLVDNAAKQAPLGIVRVNNDLPDGIEVFANPLITRVCYNLMDNAVRYGGKITNIRFFVQESDDDHLIVCEDDGEGVPAEEKEKIFERGCGKNTGMGLFLSREILAITGITIRETGEPGKGARFEMTVPEGAWRHSGET
jgi:PAS domain S-box-containing protein